MAIVLGLVTIGLIQVGRWPTTTKPVEGPILARVIADGDRAPSALAVRDAEPLAEMNAHFRRTEGWIGADGAHSVPLGPDRTLWLFSDTWVGEVREGRRFNATIVNNSVAAQQGRGTSAPFRFAVRQGSRGKPQAIIAPADGRGWFWMQAGAAVNGRLVLFLTQVEKTVNAGVFSFHSVGQWIGVVPNPDDDPTTWALKQLRLPFTIFTPERELTFGAAVLEHAGCLYVYGTDEDVRATGRERYLIAARVAGDAIDDFARWEFFHDGRWQSDFRQSTRLVPGMASDGSVSYLPDRHQFVLVYTDGGLSDRILARSAPRPWGPWSEPVTVYRCPESGWDRRIYCYNAKAHSALGTRDELVVSYVANSFEFWHVASDARLYWPRFVRVRLEPQGRRE
ncbi:MAG: DUF4185 domain-containing protein [Thermodesulfobacteriota bacterium]